MRQLLPAPLEVVDPGAAHEVAPRPAAPGRPWVALNMVASLDGATAVDGRSGGLGCAADKEVFRALRAVADVILVAAGTVRAEGYGPPRTTAERQARRVARGQAPHPRIAVVSGSLDLDRRSALFTEAPEPPIVFTSEQADPARRADLGAVAEVRTAGAASVDLAAALASLAADGAGVVLCEGGPSLNGQLAALDLIDELNLTVAPLVAAGDSDRVALGASIDPRRYALAHLWEADDTLLARYVRSS